jgi:tyrosinase
MAALFTRKNAWNNGGTFDNPDLLWYAKAVKIMQARPISDPTSWWFYAAIHGQFLLPGSMIPAPRPGKKDYRFLNWINLQYIPPSAQIGKLPAQKLTDFFWDQCQHATWFFLPWHRGYLAAIENLLRDIIVTQLNGPADWALPFWNYFKGPGQYSIPKAFHDQKLPDGTANPLFVSERYGVKIDVGNKKDQAHDLCQWDTIYNDGPDATPKGRGNLTGYYYGGGKTGFLHGAIDPDHNETGDIEENPHNTIHGMIGSQDSRGYLGLMAVPHTAALDPIFYLHHANIDRMWTAWNVTGNNKNSTDADWLKGPSANGNSSFAMPLDPNGKPWYYTPAEMASTSNLKYNGSSYSYTYEDLTLTSFNNTKPAQTFTLLERFIKLGVSEKDHSKSIIMDSKINNELVGASTSPITVKGTEANAEVKLNTSTWKSVSKSLLEASFTEIPDAVYLKLEGVKGGNDANSLSVYVNEKFVKSVSLFGLLSASMNDTGHGSGGLSFKFDITDIIDDMHLAGTINVDQLNVQIKTKQTLSEDDSITIDRIGVYRAGK